MRLQLQQRRTRLRKERHMRLLHRKRLHLLRQFRKQKRGLTKKMRRTGFSARRILLMIAFQKQ